MVDYLAKGTAKKGNQECFALRPDEECSSYKTKTRQHHLKFGMCMSVDSELLFSLGGYKALQTSTHCMKNNIYDI